MNDFFRYKGFFRVKCLSKVYQYILAFRKKTFSLHLIENQITLNLIFYDKQNRTSVFDGREKCV